MDFGCPETTLNSSTPGHELKLPGNWNRINSDFSHFSSLTSLTYLQHFSHVCPLSKVLCFIFLLDKSLTGPEMNTESFLSLRTFKKFSVFLSFVKVLHFCLYWVFYCTFHAYFLTVTTACLHVNFTSKCQRKGPGGVWCSYSPGADVPQMGIRGPLNK